MRIDKYLKVSRILKRRSISKELALHQRIEINGKTVKPSHQVDVGDIVTITFGRRQMSVKVLELAQYTRKQEAGMMYEVVDEKWLDEEEN